MLLKVYKKDTTISIFISKFAHQHSICYNKDPAKIRGEFNLFFLKPPGFKKGFH